MTALVGGVAVVASAVALGAGSLAYFSDTQSAPLATVSTGKLTLTINGVAAQLPVTVTNAEPGLVTASTPLVFANTGTVPGQLRLRVVPAATNSAEFNNDVQVTFTGLDTTTPASTSALDGPLTLADASTVTSTGAGLNGLPIATLAAGTSQSAGYVVSIDPNAGNLLQGQTGSFSLTADLIQTDNTATAVTFPAPPAVATVNFFDDGACSPTETHYQCYFTFPNTGAGVPVNFTDGNGQSLINTSSSSKTNSEGTVFFMADFTPTNVVIAAIPGQTSTYRRFTN